MPVLKAVNRPYQKKEDLENLVNYAVKGKDGAYNVYGAQGVLIGDADSMYCQMEEVKKYFRKEGGRQAMHYILSFSRDEMGHIGTQKALWIGYAFAGYCFLGWQAGFGVHTDTESLHIHFIVNTTSYENGRAYGIGPGGLEEMKQYADVLVWNYYIAGLPEEGRREAVLRGVKAMAEITE